MCMRIMFSGSKSFDQDLSKSNVAQVVDMDKISVDRHLSNRYLLCEEAGINSKVNKIGHV